MHAYRKNVENIFTLFGTKTHLDEEERMKLEKNALASGQFSSGWVPLTRAEAKMVRAILKHDFKEYPDHYFNPKGDKGYAISGGKSPQIERMVFNRIYFMTGGCGGSWHHEASMYPRNGYLHLFDYGTAQGFIVDIGRQQKLLVDNPAPTLRDILRSEFHGMVRANLRK